MQTPDLQQKKLTADEAVDFLTDRSRIHPDARIYFGDELVNELLNMLENDEIFELDAMLLQGDLTVSEMEEYLMMLPSYHEVQRGLHTWCDKLIKHITRRLGATLAETTDKHNRFNNNRGVLRMLRSVFNIINSFSNMNYGTKRNSLVHHTINYTNQALLMDIWYRVAFEPELQKYRQMLGVLVETMDKNFVQSLGHKFPGTVALMNFSALRSTYVKNHGLLDKFLLEATSSFEIPAEKEDIQSKLHEDYQQIDELSQFRRIDSISQKFGDVTVEIFSDDSPNAVRSSEVAYVKISFPGTLPNAKLKRMGETRAGDPILMTVLDYDSFQFVISRESGELSMGNSLIPLDKHVSTGRYKPFMSETDFLKMKSVIFRMLAEYLKGKSEDITKVFFKPSAATTPIQDETQQDVKHVMVKEPSVEPSPTEESVSELIEPTYVYEPFQGTPTSDSNHPVEQENQDGHEVIEDIHLDGFYNEERVISTIGRITKIAPLKSARGKARGKGSHVVVEGINGVRFPLPSHAGTDLSPAILKRCLQKLQIPYSVFKEEY